MAEDATERHVILTEIFGVHPRALVDALVVSANEHLYILGEKLEDQVRDALRERMNADQDAERGSHAIMTLMENVIDHIMDTFELYCLRSIFVITPEQSRRITLAHHRGLDLRPAIVSPTAQDAPFNEQDSHLDKELDWQEVLEKENQLRRQITAARLTQHRLAQAERAAKLRWERTNTLKSAYAFLSKEWLVPSKDTSALASAHQIREEVPRLLDALAQLRRTEPLRACLLPALSEETYENQSSIDKSEWEKGRNEYLNWESHRFIAHTKRSTSPS
ncbi:hypothetical protein MYAM1_003428 [Malassezia yamatoensis]|uniref:Uncharacterized protein n=1 Tax=Malassezia yamatoensis TaxID=253288 RepID=A0AAJ6CIV6_9BASI|nr:hypothetical protein MYAM1_003428 [Malassezia yamatoensis]